MAGTKKMKQTTLIPFGIISIVFLVYLILFARQIAQSAGNFNWNFAVVATIGGGFLIIAAAMVISLTLLHSIRKDESPFHYKTVKRLKAMAALLIIFEPFQFIGQHIVNRHNPIIIGEYRIVAVNVTNGGFILVTGLLIYCVSLVFEYGTSLQKEVDEIL